MNFKWPQNRRKPYFVPWYIIIWRMIFIPSIFIFGWLFIISVFMCYGFVDAKHAKKDIGL